MNIIGSLINKHNMNNETVEIEKTYECTYCGNSWKKYWICPLCGHWGKPVNKYPSLVN